MSPLGRAALAAMSLVSFAACGSTTVDDTVGASVPDDTIESGVIVDESSPSTTEIVQGTAADLLPEIGLDMSRLSGEISGDGDEDATLADIEQQWAAVRDEIAETHPQLLNGIEASVDLARTGVERKRPADADKAFSLLTDLVDQFFGDG